MEDKTHYHRIIDELLTKAPSFQNAGMSGYHPGLQTMADYDDMLGHPHHYYKSIHVAGTNGKGSVSHFMAAVLASAGYKTGLYTSPHLVDFRERIKIVEPSAELGVSEAGLVCNMISEDDVLDFLSSSGSFINTGKPSFFEITTAMAFDWFKKQNVDFAVIECGLGGRLDSTNIITPVLSVITAIGLDHKDILGDTIEEIASEKSGIIKTSVPVVYGEMPDEAGNVIRRTACRVGAAEFYAPVSVRSLNSVLGRAVNSLDVSEMDLKCSVQHQNIQTVSTMLDVMVGSGVLKDDSDLVPAMLDALRHTASYTGLRGRWEKLCDRPRIICDIGHNENALIPVMAQLRNVCDEYRPVNLYIIFGMASDKDISSVVHLLPQDATYIFTNAKGSRAMPAAILKGIVTSGWEVERHDLITDSVEEAVMSFYEMASENDLLFIGGSSYVVAEAIPYIDVMAEAYKYHEVSSM